MARGPCPPADRPPAFGYACETEGGNPVATPFNVDSAGVPLVQAPLTFCGTGDPVCEDSSVSGCISDTDGAPTAYGPAPAAPAPGNVAGNSPMISRLRINREGIPVFPYSVPKRPDQLIDIVIDGGEGPDVEVPWNSATGRFTIPAGVVPEPDIPSVAGCGITVNLEDDQYVIARTGDYNMATDDAQVLGSAVVLDAADGMVKRCLIQPFIENESCLPQHVHACNFPGFGVSPVTPTAQIQYGVYNETAAAVVQISQTMNFDVGWQHKESYMYPASMTPLAPAATYGDQLSIFIIVLSGEVIWVDADFSSTLWYGAGG